MKQLEAKLEPLIRSAWTGNLLGWAGMLFYLVQAAGNAFTLRSSLDEGNFLVKGYLFASGLFEPYQPYGPWVNKMPLSFLIPGWIEVLFEPGLRTGRYFAFGVQILLILGLWLLLRRETGRGWAAAAVWALALAPSQNKIYSMVISQGLTACLLIWALFFTVGEKRTRWQLLAGGLLAGLVVMTRENMLPLIPFLVVYVFWQHGWRMGIVSLIGSLLSLGIGHAVFWPDILRNWAKWIPSAVTPFLDPWRVPTAGDRTYIQSAGSWFDQLIIAFEGLRIHFTALGGALVAGLLWPRRRQWRRPGHFRAAVILLALLIVLTGAHLWASVGQDYCVYCFPAYLAFFSPLGLIVAALVLSTRLPVSLPTSLPVSLPTSLPVVSWSGFWRGLATIGAIVVVLTLTTGIMLGAYTEVTRLAAYPAILDELFHLQVPRITGGSLQPGTTELWQLLSNKFDLAFEEARLVLFPRLIAGLAGLLMGLLVLGLAVVLRGIISRRQKTVAYAAVALMTLLLFGTIFSPTTILAGGRYSFDCESNAVATFEAAGMDLAARVSPGDKIYWVGSGGVSPALLLYLPELNIYPPQLNGSYSYRSGGEADELYRYGYWNEVLKSSWLSEADILLVETRLVDQLKSDWEGNQWTIMGAPILIANCQAPIYLSVFGKNR